MEPRSSVDTHVNSLKDISALIHSIEKSEWDLAINQASQFLAKHPDNITVLHRLAHAYHQKGEFALALEVAQSLIDKIILREQPYYDSHYNQFAYEIKIDALMELGRFKRAIKNATKFIIRMGYDLGFMPEAYVAVYVRDQAFDKLHQLAKVMQAVKPDDIATAYCWAVALLNKPLENAGETVSLASDYILKLIVKDSEKNKLLMLIDAFYLVRARAKYSMNDNMGAIADLKKITGRPGNYEAVAIISPALTERFIRAAAFQGLALAYLKSNQPHLAFPTAKIAIALGQDDTKIYFTHAQAGLKCGKEYGEEAIESLNKAIEKEPKNARFYALRAELYRIQQKWEEAIQSAEYALQINSDNPLALTTLIYVYVKTRNVAKAQACLAVFHNNDADFYVPGVYEKMGNNFLSVYHLFSSGKFTEAIAAGLSYIQSVTNLTHENSLIFEDMRHQINKWLAKSYLEIGKFAQARAIALELKYNALLAESYYRVPDREAINIALSFINSALKDKPSIAHYCLAAKIYLKKATREIKQTDAFMQTLESAFSFSQEALKQDANNALALALFGEVSRLNGELDIARKYALRAIECEEKNALAYYTLAEISLEKSEFDAALKYALQASECDPRDARPYGVFFEYYHQDNRDPVKAQESLEQFFNRDPYDIRAHHLAASFYFHHHKNELALFHAQKAIELGDQDVAMYSLQAEAHRRSGHMRDAQKKAEVAIKKDFNNGLAHAVLASVYLTKFSFEKAINEATLAIQMNEYYDFVYEVLIQGYSANKNWKMALFFIDEGQKKYPALSKFDLLATEVYFARSTTKKIAEKIEDIDAGLMRLTAAIEKDPHCQRAYKDRAYYLYLKYTILRDAHCLSDKYSIASDYTTKTYINPILDDLHRLMKLKPESKWAYRMRAELRFARGDNLGVIEDASIVFAKNKKYYYFNRLKAQALMHLNRLGEAIDCANQSIAIDRESLVLRAKIYLLQKKYQAAIDDASAVIAEDTTNRGAHLIRAAAYQGLKNSLEAFNNEYNAYQGRNKSGELPSLKELAKFAILEQGNEICQLSRNPGGFFHVVKRHGQLKQQAALQNLKIDAQGKTEVVKQTRNQKPSFSQFLCEVRESLAADPVVKVPTALQALGHAASELSSTLHTNNITPETLREMENKMKKPQSVVTIFSQRNIFDKEITMQEVAAEEAIFNARMNL